MVGPNTLNFEFDGSFPVQKYQFVGTDVCTNMQMECSVYTYTQPFTCSKTVLHDGDFMSSWRFNMVGGKSGSVLKAPCLIQQ